MSGKGATRRVVVKVGTSLLTDPAGRLAPDRVRALVREVAAAHEAGHEVVIVTSGAIGAGMGVLGMETRPRALADLQAAAAVGQGLLMHHYQEEFGRFRIPVAQVLLTRDDLAVRTRYLTLRAAFLALLRRRVVPIVNENDTVAVDEIRFGDNDTLSAMVAAKVGADLLILLTDVQGLRDAAGETVEVVPRITPEIERLAGSRTGSQQGTGGMATKLEAAHIAVASGVEMVIASGFVQGAVGRVLAGERVGTRFLTRGQRLDGKKRWVAFGARACGTLVLDGGAVKALRDRATSLLPSGIVRVEGEFESGAVVRLVDAAGNEVGRGRVAYGSEEIRRIMGRHSREITARLGYRAGDEVVTRDNLVLL